MDLHIWDTCVLETFAYLGQGAGAHHRLWKIFATLDIPQHQNLTFNTKFLASNNISQRETLATLIISQRQISTRSTKFFATS